MLKHLVRCQALRVIHCQQAWYQLLCWARNFIPERRGKFKFSGQNFVEEFITIVRFAVNRQRITIFIILWQLLATSSSDDATAMIVSTNGERYTLASLHFSSQFRCNGQQHAYRQNIPSMWSIQLQKPLHPTLCLKKQQKPTFNGHSWVPITFPMALSCILFHILPDTGRKSRH